MHDHSARASRPRHAAAAAPVSGASSVLGQLSVCRIAIALSLGLTSACGDTTVKLTVPAPDAAEFELAVYPVLLRDCGFPACHGNPRRFFRVFGPGRVRYRAETALFADPTGEEIELAYERARSMLANEHGMQHSALLRKPYLGGHKGFDEWGNNVYRTADDPGYAALVDWARSAVDGGTP